MATKFERLYNDINDELTDIKDINKYTNISQAFGHFILKMLFGLTDEEALDCCTDGSDDNGIDAIYIESDKKVHFFQFKFPSKVKNINKGVSDEEVLKLCNGVQSFVSTDEIFNTVSWNDLLKDKRQEFLAADICDLKLWVVRYSNQDLSNSSDVIINNYMDKYYKETGNSIEFEKILAMECMNLYESRAKNIWPDFVLPYSKTLTPFTDEKASISSAYVSLKSIYDTFYSIQDTVFEGNVRFLSPNSKINDGIRETILTSPENFHLLNNGITIVCKGCSDINAKSYFNVKCGSIINGAQTVGTIINTLFSLTEEQRKQYDKSFVFVKIISFSNDNSLINDMVYTLNTQNQMKNSYTIDNDIIVKKLQEKINKETEYFLEIKNNEFNYCKNNMRSFNKLSKNKIDIESFIQAYTTFYDIAGMGALSKNNKASLFTNENIQKIINELTFEKALLPYNTYLELMNIIKEYRAFRKNPDKTDILSILDISENEIDDYRYLNTGNYVVLFALGQIFCNKELDPRKNMIPVIKALRLLFKKEKNVSNATKIKETFDKVEKYVKRFKIENEIIIPPKKVDLSKL
jgi:hypothetical protein